MQAPCGRPKGSGARWAARLQLLQQLLALHNVAKHRVAPVQQVGAAGRQLRLLHRVGRLHSQRCTWRRWASAQTPAQGGPPIQSALHVAPLGVSPDSCTGWAACPVSAARGSLHAESAQSPAPGRSHAGSAACHAGPQLLHWAVLHAESATRAAGTALQHTAVGLQVMRAPGSCTWQLEAGSECHQGTHFQHMAIRMQGQLHAMLAPTSFAAHAG